MCSQWACRKTDEIFCGRCPRVPLRRPSRGAVPYSARMPSASSTRKWALVLTVPLALLLLNASLTFENVWPTPKIRWGNSVSIELAVCALLLAIAHRRARALRAGCCPHLGRARGRPLSRRDRSGPVRPRVQSLLGLAASRQRDGDARPRRTVVAHRARMATLVAVVALVFVMSRLALRWLASAMELPMARRALGASRQPCSRSLPCSNCRLSPLLSSRSPTR